MIVGFIFQGCATVNLTVPLNEIESPVHQGRQNGFGFEYMGTTGLQLKPVDDPSKRPYTSAVKHNVDSVFLTAPGFNYYTLNRVTLTSGLMDSKSPYLKMKVAILNGYNEATEAGRLEMAIYGEGSYQRAYASGTQNGIGGASGFPWESTLELYNFKAGLSFGVQLTRKILLFTGINYQQFSTSGTINQTSVTADAGGTYKVQPEPGILRTAGLGMDWRISTRFFFMTQFLYSNFQWYENKDPQYGGVVKLTYIPVQ